MKLIQQVETFDGKVFADERAAYRHLEVLHADLLSKLAHECCQHSSKYKPIGDWIDDNLDRFAELQKIKADMILSNPEED